MVNGKDQSNIMERVPMKGIVYAYVGSEAILVVSLLIVEFGTEGTVKRHSRNCQAAAFEFLESIELCRRNTDELHLLGRPAQFTWSSDKLTIYKSVKSTSVYNFTHNYCLHWSVP